MTILIVCSITNGQVAPFIREQAESLQRRGVSISFYTVHKKGLLGYGSALPGLWNTVRKVAPDIVHAHYGLSGMLANLQRKVPVITTFHGSDINNPKVLKWSRWAMKLSRHSIFVSRKIAELSGIQNHFSVLPCGVDTSLFFPVDKQNARKQLGWNATGTYILFAGTKENTVKNYPLARQAASRIANSQLIELKNYDRTEVNLLMNAADVALLTSFSEGSPQFVKEALACNCPLVSTDVGDVLTLTEGVEGCFITTFDVESVTDNLQRALQFTAVKNRTEGRSRIETEGLSLEQVASRLLEIYKQCAVNEK